MQKLRVHWEFGNKVVQIPKELIKKLAIEICKLEAEMVTKTSVSRTAFVKVLNDFYQSALKHYFSQLQLTASGKHLGTYQNFIAEMEVGNSHKPILKLCFGYKNQTVLYNDNFNSTYVSFFTGMLAHIKQHQISKSEYLKYCTKIDVLTKSIPNTDEENKLLAYLEDLDEVYDCEMPKYINFAKILEEFGKLGYEPVYKPEGEHEYTTKVKISHLLYDFSQF